MLKHGPEHYACTLERSGESLIQTAVQEFNRQADGLSRSASHLANQIKGSRERSAQNRNLCAAIAAGIIVGILGGFYSEVRLSNEVRAIVNCDL